MTIVAFFNNKGGVGKTSLVYHLAWMFAEAGLSVVAMDLDPQANLTSMFLDDSRLEEIWASGKHPDTIQAVIEPILRGLGDIRTPHIEEITPKIGLVNGDLALSGFEDKLSQSWPACHNRDEAAFRAMTAFYRTARNAGLERDADVILLDVGPNLGAINRSALIASQFVVIPLAPDLFSLQGLQNMGPQLREWRRSWAELRTKNPDPDLEMPSGEMTPAGYVLMQHATRANRPVKAYKRWVAKIPAEYEYFVLGINSIHVREPVDKDPNCLQTLKQYRSLMPLAMEARKPMFSLKPADGAIGAHQAAVRDCWLDFSDLAHKIQIRCGF